MTTMRAEAVAAASDHGVRVADLEWLFGASRRTLHRDAETTGTGLPARPRRLPRTRGEMAALIDEHGLSPRKIADALGIRKSTHVRDLMRDWGFVKTWWGVKGNTYAEWVDL